MWNLLPFDNSCGAFKQKSLSTIAYNLPHWSPIHIVMHITFSHQHNQFSQGWCLNFRTTSCTIRIITSVRRHLTFNTSELTPQTNVIRAVYCLQFLPLWLQFTPGGLLAIFSMLSCSYITVKLFPFSPKSASFVEERTPIPGSQTTTLRAKL